MNTIPLATHLQEVQPICAVGMESYWLVMPACAWKISQRSGYHLWSVRSLSTRRWSSQCQQLVAVHWSTVTWLIKLNPSTWPTNSLNLHDHLRSSSSCRTQFPAGTHCTPRHLWLSPMKPEAHHNALWLWITHDSLYILAWKAIANSIQVTNNYAFPQHALLSLLWLDNTESISIVRHTSIQVFCLLCRSVCLSVQKVPPVHLSHTHTRTHITLHSNYLPTF